MAELILESLVEPGFIFGQLQKSLQIFLRLFFEVESNTSEELQCNHSSIYSTFIIHK